MSKIIRITSKVEGFRRAGIAHSAQPVDHQADAFSDEQLAALQAEPMLTVEIIDAGGQAPAGDDDTADAVDAPKSKTKNKKASSVAAGASAGEGDADGAGAADNAGADGAGDE